MIRKFTISILLALSCVAVYAGQEEAQDQTKTRRWSFVSGSSSYVNEFFNNQEFSGSTIGLEFETGTFYKKNDNISWDMKVTLLSSPEIFTSTNFTLQNPAGTSYISTTEISAEYGSYYNWTPIKGLSIKAGGTSDLLVAVDRSKPNSINNVISPQFQLLFKAAAGARYTWEFKKFDLRLFGDFSIPILGIVSSDSEFQATLDVITGKTGLLKGTLGHFALAAPHNVQGYNMEIGADLVFDNFNIFISNESYNRWWNIYDTQNYRKMSLFKIGFSVNLVKLPYRSTNNRYF